MTIRGDMEAMLNKLGDGSVSGEINDNELPGVIRDIFDWLVSGDVLRYLARENVDGGDAALIVWLDHVEALKTKCAPPRVSDEHNSDIVHRGSKCAIDTGTVYPCNQCGKHHMPMTPCKDPRIPGSPQSETHGIQAVKRWATSITHIRPIVMRPQRTKPQ